jgi:SAM-dependent methyltransferase
VHEHADRGTAEPWRWDRSLYAGSARYYSVGRVRYPVELADTLAERVPLDGSGVLLDVGCGPGSMTLLLAPHVERAIGVDPDEDMLAEAALEGRRQKVPNVSWRQMRAEDLPAELPPARLVVFAQSFHWMDRPRVAGVVRRMLAPGGAVVHVGATTHEGVDPDRPLPHPMPPRAEITALVRLYLGPRRRAGAGVAPEHLAGSGPSSVEPGGRPGWNGQGEDDIFRAAGFEGPQRLDVPGRLVERSADEVAASVYSLSSAAPHLFGDRFEAFDRQLRQLLDGASAEGRFSEQMGSIGLSIWR